MTFLQLSCRAIGACTLSAVALMLFPRGAAADWGEIGYRPGRLVRIDQGTRCEPKQPTCSLYLAIHQSGLWPQARIRCDLLDQGRRLRIYDTAVKLTEGGVNFQTAEFAQRPLRPKEPFHTPDIRCWSSQEITQAVDSLKTASISIVPEQWRFRRGNVEAITVRRIVTPLNENRKPPLHVGSTTQVRCGFYQSGYLVRIAETAVVDGDGTGTYIGTMTLDPPIPQVTGIECAEGQFENGTWFNP